MVGHIGLVALTFYRAFWVDRTLADDRIDRAFLDDCLLFSYRLFLINRSLWVICILVGSYERMDPIKVVSDSSENIRHADCAAPTAVRDDSNDNPSSVRFLEIHRTATVTLRNNESITSLVY